MHVTVNTKLIIDVLVKASCPNAFKIALKGARQAYKDLQTALTSGIGNRDAVMALVKHPASEEARLALAQQIMHCGLDRDARVVELGLLLTNLLDEKKFEEEFRRNARASLSKSTIDRYSAAEIDEAITKFYLQFVERQRKPIE